LVFAYTQKSSFKNEICVLLGYYAASGGNFLPTFRDNLSVLCSGGQESKHTSVRNYHYSLLNSPKRAQFSSASRRKLEIIIHSFTV